MSKLLRPSDELRRILHPLTRQNIFAVPDKPLSLDLIPSLADTTQWSDYSERHSDKSARFHQKLKEEFAVALQAVIPEAIISPDVYVYDQLHSKPDHDPVFQPHLDVTNKGQVRQSRPATYAFTATAAYPNSTEFYPDLSVGDFCLLNSPEEREEAYKGKYIPRRGEAVLWNDDRFVHNAPKFQETSIEEWHEILKNEAAPDKVLFGKGLRRVMIRSIMQVPSEWVHQQCGLDL